MATTMFLVARVRQYGYFHPSLYINTLLTDNNLVKINLLELKHFQWIYWQMLTRVYFREWQQIPLGHNLYYFA